MHKKNLWLLAVLGLTAVVVGLFRPRYFRARHRVAGGGCKINLKSLGYALELYSEDHQGKYPEKLGALVPKYLTKVPSCDVTGPGSYRMVTGPGMGYNKGTPRYDGSRSQPFDNYYLIWCEGDKHHQEMEIPVNYPQYDSISGLLER